MIIFFGIGSVYRNIFMNLQIIRRTYVHDNIEMV